jgi:hypothetical protein
MRRAAIQRAPQSACTQTSCGALRIGPANDRFEKKADRAAERIDSGESERLSWSLSRVGLGPLQRECTNCEEAEKKRLQRGARWSQRLCGQRGGRMISFDLGSWVSGPNSVCQGAGRKNRTQ